MNEPRPREIWRRRLSIEMTDRLADALEEVADVRVRRLGNRSGELVGHGALPFRDRNYFLLLEHDSHPGVAVRLVSFDEATDHDDEVSHQVSESVRAAEKLATQSSGLSASPPLMVVRRQWGAVDGWSQLAGIFGIQLERSEISEASAADVDPEGYEWWDEFFAYGDPRSPGELCIQVESIQEAVAAVVQAGGRVQDGVEWEDRGRVAMGFDHVGAHFMLWEPGESRFPQLGAPLAISPWCQLRSSSPATHGEFYKAVAGWTTEVVGGEGPLAGLLNAGRFGVGSIEQADEGPWAWSLSGIVPDAELLVAGATSAGVEVIPLRPPPGARRAHMLAVGDGLFSLVEPDPLPPRTYYLSQLLDLPSSLALALAEFQRALDFAEEALRGFLNRATSSGSQSGSRHLSPQVRGELVEVTDVLLGILEPTQMMSLALETLGAMRRRTEGIYDDILVAEGRSTKDEGARLSLDIGDKWRSIGLLPEHPGSDVSESLLV